MLFSEKLFLCYICVVTVCLIGVKSDIFDIFGNRLGSTSARVVRNSDFYTRFYKNDTPAVKLIRKYGYKPETHEVQTEDGYLLQLHRIPKPGKRAVLLCHGLLGSSATWLLRGPEKDLVFILADSGYDVWLINVRGNAYSRKHKQWDPDRDKKFWDFSFHEIGYYDLPATIDYILNVTEEKSLIYIGHSMGTTVFFVMCSTRPEYNTKITLMHGLAPAVYIVHRPSPIMKFVISSTPVLVESCKEQNVFEIFPLKKITVRLGKALCYNSAPTQPLCLAGVFLVTGVDYQQMNTSLLPVIFEHYPAGASLNTFLHFHQNVMNASFRHMDYGEKENVVRYKRKQPPDYNVKRVTAPVALYYGDGDFLVKRDDTEMLAKQLPNLVGVFKVPFAFFNHLDFLVALDSKTLLYEQILLITNKYR